MPQGASWRFNGNADGGNLDDPNVNSLEIGGNVYQSIPNALTVEVTPIVFTSSALIREEFVGAAAEVVAPSTTNAVYLLPGGPPTIVVAGAFPGGEHYPLAEVDTDGVGVVAIRDKRPKGTSVVGGGPPTGPAGGDLAGSTYPNPVIAPLAIDNAKVAAGAAIAESKLALGFPTHSTANDPSAGEKAALAGTTGVPGGGNQYVTTTDARMGDARAPLGHGASHLHGGADPIATSVPGANAIPKALGTGKLDDGWINRQVRGDDRQYVVAEARTTTTLALPQLKLQIVTGVLTGTYKFDYMADVDNNNSVLKGVVRLYNVTDAVELDRYEYGQAATPLNGAIRWKGFVDVVLAGVSKTIEIQWFDVLGGGTQGIAKARMEMIRVA